MTGADGLVLRDIHELPAPSWWPPAPGWWLAVAVLAVASVLLIAWGLRRRRRAAAVARLFDETVHAHDAAAARVAAMSDLLRRAARRRDRQADRLQGEAWLAFLDGAAKQAPFSNGPGRLLLEGGFRRSLEDAQVRALEPVARARYVALMSGRP